MEFLKRFTKNYYSANDGLNNQNIYHSIDSNKIKVFLDPNQLSADGTTSLKLISFFEDRKYCAYHLSKACSE